MKGWIITNAQTVEELSRIFIDDDPRPLAKAADILEQHYGWVVTYEDPPFQFDQDIIDVTAAVRRTYARGQQSVLTPRGGRLLVEFDLTGQTTEPAGVIKQLLEAYERHPLPGHFVAVSTKEVTHLVPTSIRNQAGNQVQLTSILDTQVELNAGDLTLANIIGDVLQQVSNRTGTKIVLGTAPPNLLLNTRIQQETFSGPARAALVSALGATDTRLSWRMLYGPDAKMYALNLHQVPSPAQ